MKRILGLIIGILALFTSIFAAEKPLVVGMELAYPPFEMTDASGKPTGLSVDLATELGKYLGREVKIENIAWTGLLPSLLTKKVDIILSSMSITEERKKAVNFSDMYAESFLTLLVYDKSPVQKAADLNDAKRVIVVKAGSTAHLTAQKYFPKATIRVVDKESAAVLEVSQGKADAFIYDPLTVLKNQELNPKTTRAILEKFQTEKEGWGIAYRKDDMELGNKINAFLKDFKAKKGFDPLVEKYLSKEKEVFKKQGIPFFIGN